MFWQILNAGCGLVAAGIITFKLATRAHKFIRSELIGMGLIGSGMVLTIGPIWSPNTPFDDWSTTLLRVGCCIYFIGRMMRHRTNNLAMKRQAREHFHGRRQ